MKTIAKPTQAALAAAMGITPPLVTRYRKRGMPVDSVSEAVAWRDANIRVRISVNSPAERISAAIQGESAARKAAALLNAAGELLEAGGDISPMVPSLRQAMASVPPSQRERVLLPVSVMDVLTDDVYQLFERGDPHGQIIGSLYEVDAKQGQEIDMGAFWYAVASGEGLGDDLAAGEACSAKEGDVHGGYHSMQEVCGGACGV